MPAPAAALAVWTLVVWGGRIRNALSADEGLAPLLLAASFVALAVAVLATRAAPLAVAALAGWTTAVWAVRIVDIALFSDHDAGFVVVHGVLAVVSVALAAWAARRTLTRSGRARQPVAG